MRISVKEQSKDFIKLCKSKNTWVYKKPEIKKSVRDYLLSKNYTFSPYDGIYVIKKSTDTKYSAIKNNIHLILNKMGGIIGGEYALNYYLGKKKFLNEYIIYKGTTQFNSTIGEGDKLKVKFKRLNNRKSKKVDIEGVKLNIESPLSLIVNNIKDMGENEDFINFVLKQHFDSNDILQAVFDKYKISGLSKLAIMYKNYKREGQYNIIKNVLESTGKKLDRRNNKVRELIKPKIKDKPKEDNLNDLF